MPVDPLLTIENVAAKLQLDDRSIRRMLRANELPYHRVGSRRGAIRIAPSDLNDYLISKRVAPKEAAPQPIKQKRPAVKRAEQAAKSFWETCA